VVIVETSVFTRQITGLLSDEEYRAFQEALVRDPKLGEVIPGSGGLRKVRWARSGSGKRSGLRIIYYVIDRRGRIYLLLAYPKSSKEDTSARELRALRALMEDV
jgi:mRNA-degrading endonuclease RelE of RelBE toxin-antitoxin system